MTSPEGIEGKTAAGLAEKPPLRPSAAPGKFVTGSLLRHILVMTGTSGVGLGAIFIGDFANIAFLAWLKDDAVVAAVGYASSILFFTVSVGIGLSIAAISLVSREIGARRREDACRLCVNVHLATLAVALVTTLIVWLSIPWLLSWLGASGRTHELGSRYLEIIVPSLPMMSLAMTSSAVLRSVGDAKRSMHVTLIGALANTLLDPILIFGLKLGIDGAAIASMLSRIIYMFVGFYGVVYVHKLYVKPHLKSFVADLPQIMRIAVPAMLSNIATPISNAYVTVVIARYGDAAVAGWAILGRVMPLAFGPIYALSGCIGPIIGQNYGAGLVDRMRRTFGDSMLVTLAFTLIAWVGLALSVPGLLGIFHASGEAADLIRYFCYWLAPLFSFMGFLFVANAVFNTLGRPHYSTVLNWGRATIGTVPFVEAGGKLMGAEGVLLGHMLGAVVFGTLAAVICRRSLP